MPTEGTRYQSMDNFVEIYRELEPFKDLKLPYIKLVMGREKETGATLASIRKCTFDNLEGIQLFKLLVELSNHFYDVLTEWLGMKPSVHHVCVTVESGVDIKEMKTEDGELIDVIMINPNMFRSKKKEGEMMVIDMYDMVSRVVYLMLYSDIAIHDRKRDEAITMKELRRVISGVSMDVLNYIRDILRSAVDEKSGS